VGASIREVRGASTVSALQRILRAQFIDFNTLHSGVMFSLYNVPSSATSSTARLRPEERITSFTSWLDAWNTYFYTIVAHNPSRALELLGYQCIIFMASRVFSFPAWSQYDIQFRTLAAANPSLPWNVCHYDLWFKCTGISSNTRPERWPEFVEELGVVRDQWVQR